MSSLSKCQRAHKLKLIIVLKANEKLPMLERTIFSEVNKLLASVEPGEKNKQTFTKMLHKGRVFEWLSVKKKLQWNWSSNYQGDRTWRFNKGFTLLIMG